MLTLSEKLQVCIQLPSSKSICNRMIIINKLAHNKSSLHNLSNCDDTEALIKALDTAEQTINIGAAGTTMRFLTALYTTKPGQRILTGSKRMLQRPIGVLVDALRLLGADIEYTQNEGFPPLRINGNPLRGGSITLPAHVSSQYISALLMIGPSLKEGLQLHLEGNIASRPYIDMTIALMQQNGASVAWMDEATIKVNPQPYQVQPTVYIESDWSAASYWYELVALSPDPEAKVELPHLFKNSLQGDCRVADFFRPLGVQTTYTDNGVVLTKSARESLEKTFALDLSDQPDLAQTLVVTCAMLQKPFHFTGLHTLKIKETDRIHALRTELQKFGINVNEANNSELFCTDFSTHNLNAKVEIDTYDDHRMAMAFAPCAYLYPNLHINNPEVVSKSYPDFWKHICKEK
ncbi:MAG: 3-phosphoshikimate 1-carboxyvinyltransferase [Bacteroidaceae bacterium]|nr:3-phosphoshikimate 1-carboxyvinyltransferase [Bacteroidaceae bacterium]